MPQCGAEEKESMMAWPQPSRKYECVSCGWLRRTPGGSDVLCKGLDHFDECPECGGTDLKVTVLGGRSQSPIPNLGPTLIEQIQRWLKYRR